MVMSIHFFTLYITIIVIFVAFSFCITISREQNNKMKEKKMPHKYYHGLDFGLGK